MTQHLQNCKISSEYLVSKVDPANNKPSFFSPEFRDSFHELIVRLWSIFVPVSSIKQQYLLVLIFALFSFIIWRFSRKRILFKFKQAKFGIYLMVESHKCTGNIHSV